MKMETTMNSSPLAMMRIVNLIKIKNKNKQGKRRSNLKNRKQLQNLIRTFFENWHQTINLY